ncbi:hypothetical protein [Sulfurospirillum diekertiae]|uniref:Uncharacterized protein n=1 Tax=Sulfurospirillum diekertiae TaxID=1854492 RepID=A0A1Y0HJ47_9BACT|nr:hypothetical protein [Sulfurospirillum diekertiae]ARU48121.1 hypothetical protein Sdiek1_0955 [Sulfurospirillum diekertiae]ASC92964.1 hypothetical protein Sdiek2_0943 [Sulfurospirillum diekertiae]
MSSYILLKHNHENNTTTTAQTVSPTEEGVRIPLGDSNLFTSDLLIMGCVIACIALALYLWIRPLCLEIKSVEQKLFARDVAEEVCKKMKDEL